MLNKVNDYPGLKPSSMLFATNEYAKYQDLKKRNEKNGTGTSRRMEISITNVIDDVLAETRYQIKIILLIILCP